MSLRPVTTAKTSKWNTSPTATSPPPVRSTNRVSNTSLASAEGTTVPARISNPDRTHHLPKCPVVCMGFSLFVSPYFNCACWADKGTGYEPFLGSNCDTTTFHNTLFMSNYYLLPLKTYSNIRKDHHVSRPPYSDSAPHLRLPLHSHSRRRSTRTNQ